MKKIYTTVFLLVLYLLTGSLAVSATEYTVAIFQFQPEVTESFVAMFKALGETTGQTFKVQVVSPSRAIALLENKQVDIAFPATESNNAPKRAAVKYDYSTAKLYQMVFVLYTNKSKPLNLAELKKGNPGNYVIETTVSLADIVDFKTQPTMNQEGSLQRVEQGLIDGFVYAQEVGDGYLKKLKLKNISRSLYSYNNISCGLQKGTTGSELDKILTKGINVLKSNGKLKEILAISINNSTYVDWQP